VTRRGFRESSLGYQVNHLARLLANALRRRIAGYGVAPGQFAQLLALYEEDGITQAQLCHRVQIEQPTMASTLARMERDGLVRRIPDPDDGRRSLIVLTPHARALEDQLVAAAQEVNAAATRGLTDAEVAAFRSASARMIANLEAGLSEGDERPTRSRARS
jgi:DNA-binding MarR family transcriptional regulator